MVHKPSATTIDFQRVSRFKKEFGTQPFFFGKNEVKNKLF